jgi:LacI family transcriptional regulator
MKRPTIKDIARQLGVNPSTVSRALKDHPDIGVTLRTEIKKLAEALHYRPNQMAVQLRQRSSRLIGLIVPEVTMFFYPSVIKGIQSILHEQGYNLIMLSSDESPKRELDNIRICAENEVAGIMLAVVRETQTPAHLDMLHELGIPILMFDKVREELPFDSVELEDVDAATVAVKHLILQGCRNIGGLFGNPNMLITQKRIQGYRAALENNGLVFDADRVLFADDALEAATCAKQLMDRHPALDGIFAMTDEIIMGAMGVIAHAGRRIPEDCSVICISDGFLPYCLHPNVTFLHHDGFTLGKLAAQRLLTLAESEAFINDGYKGEKIAIQTNLVVLDTTRNT